MLENKVKGIEKAKGLFFALIGEKRSKSLLASIIKRKYGGSFKFPLDIATIKKILIILPEEELDVIFQFKNIISLMNLFKYASLTLICERSVSSYLRMIPGLNVVEYDRNERSYMILPYLTKEIGENFDICFLLSTNPPSQLLYFTGLSGAPLRVGYKGAGEYPFINIHISPSLERQYVVDKYCAMADFLGAKQGEIKWKVANKTIQEVEHLMREIKIDPTSSLIGFDAVYFIRNFGTEWTETLLTKVKELNAGILYFYLNESVKDEELVWICRQNVPSFTELSTSRLAALISKSKFIVSGKTVLYALAGLLQRPAFGFFKREEIHYYCPQDNTLFGVPFAGKPDKIAIEKMIEIIRNNALK